MVGSQERGYFGIGIYHVKNGINIGGLWRHAQAFGAAFIFTIGRRYKKQASDTIKSIRHIPLFHFPTSDDFLAHRPHNCVLIGVEIAKGSIPLPQFEHPERAIYLLGAEDHGLPDRIIKKCNTIIEIPTLYCLNVATTGGIVMYDRMAKRKEE